VNKMILLVEDNPDDEALTLRAVKKHMPHGIVVARDGAEALAALANEHANVKLVLTDWNMPKMDGFE